MKRLRHFLKRWDCSLSLAVAESLAASKRQEMLRLDEHSEEVSRLDRDHSEDIETANVAYRLAVRKRDELYSFLAAMAEEWRDKTNPPD